MGWRANGLPLPLRIVSPNLCRTDVSTVPLLADEPLARLPDEITLTRGEAAIVLFGLDVVERAEIAVEDATTVCEQYIF